MTFSVFAISAWLRNVLGFPRRLDSDIGGCGRQRPGALAPARDPRRIAPAVCRWRRAWCGRRDWPCCSAVRVARASARDRCRCRLIWPIVGRVVRRCAVRRIDHASAAPESDRHGSPRRHRHHGLRPAAGVDLLRIRWCERLPGATRGGADPSRGSWSARGRTLPHRDGIDILHPRRQRQRLPRGATVLGAVNLPIIASADEDLIRIGLMHGD
jgi:hypothetical protein